MQSEHQAIVGFNFHKLIEVSWLTHKITCAAKMYTACFVNSILNINLGKTKLKKKKHT